MSALSVCVVDDDPACDLCSEELASLGWAVHRFTSVGELIEKNGLRGCALLVLDLELPRDELLVFLRRLREIPGAPPALVLTDREDDDAVLEALKAGAVGCLSCAEVGDGGLARAARDVLCGGGALSPRIARRVLRQLAEPSLRPPSIPPGVTIPSVREREVLLLLSRGLTYQETAGIMSVSVDTVRTHVRSIYRKLHASSKAEAVAVALRSGWLD